MDPAPKHCAKSMELSVVGRDYIGHKKCRYFPWTISWLHAWISHFGVVESRHFALGVLTCHIVCP